MSIINVIFILLLTVLFSHLFSLYQFLYINFCVHALPMPIFMPIFTIQFDSDQVQEYFQLLFLF